MACLTFVSNEDSAPKKSIGQKGWFDNSLVSYGSPLRLKHGIMKSENYIVVIVFVHVT